MGKQYTPDFNELLKVLRREKPSRPVLFELILNLRLADKYCDPGCKQDERILVFDPYMGTTFTNLGYDYWLGKGADLMFKMPKRKQVASLGMAHGGIIHNRAEFDAYEWPDPDAFDYSLIDGPTMPGNSKMIIWGPGGVLENVTALVGFEDLCFMLVDDETLVSDLFERIGSILTRYYELCMPYNNVGAGLVNDDWGFRSQTMLSVDQMRKYVIPWHKKMVEHIHASGRPAIMHSCGNLTEVMEDIVSEIKFDSKHSYEDTITPVETMYERWSDRISILGGLDVDYLITADLADVRARADRLIDMADEKGGYALGSGNSIPEYVPDENFLTMIDAARERW